MNPLFLASLATIFVLDLLAAMIVLYFVAGKAPVLVAYVVAFWVFAYVYAKLGKNHG